MTRRAWATLAAVALFSAALGLVRYARRRARVRVAVPAHDDSFVALRSLQEARELTHTAVIMQGGDGDQIYLTVPTAHVRCDETALRQLLALFDRFGRRRPASAALSFELAPVGSGVYGGDGGLVVDGIWLHPELEAAGLRDAAAAVIVGERSVADVRRELRAPT